MGVNMKCENWHSDPPLVALISFLYIFRPWKTFLKLVTSEIKLPFQIIYALYQYMYWTTNRKYIDLHWAMSLLWAIPVFYVLHDKCLKTIVNPFYCFPVILLIVFISVGYHTEVTSPFQWKLELHYTLSLVFIAIIALIYLVIYWIYIRKTNRFTELCNDSEMDYLTQWRTPETQSNCGINCDETDVEVLLHS